MENDQLEEIINSFSEHHLQYWVDNGTLLGLVRDGELLSFTEDSDLDLSVWRNDVPKLLDAIKNMDSNYIIKRRRYRGNICRVKLCPIDRYDREVDIKVFSRQDRYAVCPQDLTMDNPYSTPNPLYYLYGIPRHIIYKLFYDYRIREPDISKRICGRGIRHTVGSWRIPIKLIGQPKIDPKIGVRTPERTADYLEYQYGDWKTPVDEWVWYEDIGGFSLILPNDIE